MRIAKPPDTGLRSFGVSLPGQHSSHPIFIEERSTTPTSRENSTPKTAAKHFSFQLFSFSPKMLQRRRNKVVGFIIAEASAIGLLLVAGAFALSLKPADPTLAWSINIVTIASAAAVAIIPILFFALVPILPRADR